MATIPAPLATDAEDVCVALEVAQTQWTRGDPNEALKWLRRAADAAFEANDDKRGIALSKLAAELTAEVRLTRRSKATPAHQAQPTHAQPSAPQAPPLAARKAPSAPQAAKPRSVAGPKSWNSSQVPTRQAHPSRKHTAKAPLRTSRPAEDDDATREYVMTDLASANNSGDEWPTEAGDNFDEQLQQELTEERDSASLAQQVLAAHATAPAKESAPMATTARSTAPAARPARSPAPTTRPARSATPARASAATPKTASPAHQAQEAPPDIPVLQALRVAVGRDDRGAVTVRLLDIAGLKEGEHDAMLVALTKNDLRTLFGGK